MIHHKTWLCCLVLMRLTSAVPVTYQQQLQQQQQRPQVQYVDQAGNPVDPQQAQALLARYQAQPQPQQLQPQQLQPQPQQLIQAQPQQYRVRAQQPGLPPQQARGQLPEDYDPNPQYQFSFDVRDDQFTNYQNRKEQREGDKISGSYSVVDSDGFIRTVKYTADPLEGFKAQVTREPTDIVVKLPQPPAPAPLSARQPQQFLQQQQPQQVYQPQQINLQQQAYQQQQQRDSAGSGAGAVVDLESVARQQLQAQARAQQQFALGVQPPRNYYQQQ